LSPVLAQLSRVVHLHCHALADGRSAAHIKHKQTRKKKSEEKIISEGEAAAILS
jgi:hypothetical protein